MTTTYELDDDSVPSRAVYAAVSTADGRSPLDLPPLGWSVDPAALDALLTGEGNPEITFEYCGWLVTATPDVILVESAGGEASGSGDEEPGAGNETPVGGDE